MTRDSMNIITNIIKKSDKFGIKQKNLTINQTYANLVHST